MLLLDVIGPIFALVGCGYLLGRRRKIDTEPLADVAIYICLPFLLFSTLVRHPVTGLAALQMFAWQGGMYLCSIPLIWLVARLFGWDSATRSAVTLSLPTVNVASYGVPVVLFALGDESGCREWVLPTPRSHRARRTVTMLCGGRYSYLP